MGKVKAAPLETPVKDRAVIIAELVRRKVKPDRAGIYADAYLEYWEAAENIRTHGAMVLHPQTANPIENPYLKIRDRALEKLRQLRGIHAEFLW
jgi:phage terminase small subunit